MSSDRGDVAGLFSGKASPGDDATVPDRTAGIPAPPPTPRPAPEIALVATPDEPTSPAAAAAATPTKATTPRPRTAAEPGRITVPLAPGVAERLAAAAADADLWLYEFLEIALDRHEAELKAKGGVVKHRRRRGAARLAPSQVRLSAHAGKRARQIAQRHGLALADVMRTLIDLALADVDDDDEVNLS